MRTRLAATILLVVGLFCAVPANAHTDLVRSDPADGTTLVVPPEMVQLTFNAPPLDLGMELVLLAPGGEVQPMKPRIQGRSIVADWPGGNQQGAYRISYRVVAADGHPIVGQVNFVVGDAAASEPPVQVESNTEESAPNLLLPLGIAVLVMVGVGGIAVSRRR